MDIETSKIALIKMILNIENDAFIEIIKTFVKEKSADFWEELSSQERNEILLGIQQLEDGERISMDDVMRKIS